MDEQVVIAKADLESLVYCAEELTAREIIEGGDSQVLDRDIKRALLTAWKVLEKEPPPLFQREWNLPTGEPPSCGE